VKDAVAASPALLHAGGRRQLGLQSRGHRDAQRRRQLATRREEWREESGHWTAGGKKAVSRYCFVGPKTYLGRPGLRPVLKIFCWALKKIQGVQVVIWGTPKAMAWVVLGPNPPLKLAGGRGTMGSLHVAGLYGIDTCVCQAATMCGIFHA
jgi:hypothetical protein